MRVLPFISKVKIAVYLLCAVSAVNAQPVIHYFPAKNLRFANPLIAGRTQQTTLVIDRPDSLQSVVYFFDSSYQLVQQKQLPAVLYDAPFFSNNEGVHFVWQERVNDSILFKLTRISADGHVLPLQKMIPAEAKGRTYHQVVADRQSRFFFFFSIFKNQQSVFLRGILFDQQLAVLKKIDRAFAFDEELQRLCSPLVDVKGNIHFLLYDKLTNYRLSANAELYTIPSDGDDAIVESFQFQKAKFYDVILYDHPAGSEIRLAGFYYDGSDKIKQGLACISFPYERGNPASEKYFPLSKEQRVLIQQDMEHVRRKNDVMDFLKLKDIYEEEGHVYFSTWLMDVPNQLFYKDNEREALQNREVVTWMKGASGILPPGAVRVTTRSVITAAPVVNSVMGVMPMSDVVSPQQNGNVFLSVRELSNPFLPNLPVAGINRPGSFNASYGYGFRPKKIGIFSIPETGDTMWFRMMPGDYHIRTATYEPALWNYPLAVNGGLQFVHPHQQGEWGTDKKQKKDSTDTLQPMLVKVDAQGTFAQPFSQLVLNDRLFFYSKPLRIADGKYLSAFKGKGDGNNGIALLTFVTRE